MTEIRRHRPTEALSADQCCQEINDRTLQAESSLYYATGLSQSTPKSPERNVHRSTDAATTQTGWQVIRSTLALLSVLLASSVYTQCPLGVFQKLLIVLLALFACNKGL